MPLSTGQILGLTLKHPILAGQIFGMLAKDPTLLADVQANPLAGLVAHEAAVLDLATLLVEAVRKNPGLLATLLAAVVPAP